MSAIRFELDAQHRSDKGKGASRRLRHTNLVPAIIYGGGEEPVSITLEHRSIQKALSHEAFYSHILDLKVADKSEKVILKDVQRHPAKPRILHIDFQRVRADQKLHMHVPLHFQGEDVAPGLVGGGIFSHLMAEVEVVCLPANLPEFISVDVSKMELNDAIHLSELTLPEGVELTALAHGVEGHDQVVISIHMPRTEAEEEPAAEATEDAGTGETGETATAEGGKKADASESHQAGKKED